MPQGRTSPNLGNESLRDLHGTGRGETDTLRQEPSHSLGAALGCHSEGVLRGMHFTFNDTITLCGRPVSSVTKGRVDCWRCISLWADKLVETHFLGGEEYPSVCRATTESGI